MSKSARLCGFCGSPMRRDGSRFVCQAAGTAHPVQGSGLARMPALGGRGGWLWALGLGVGALVAELVVSLIAWRGVVYEPLAMVTAYATAGALLGWLPMFGYRMHRAHPSQWAATGRMAGVVGFQALLVALAGTLWLRLQPNWTLAFLLAGWGLGVLGAYLPYSRLSRPPAQRLVAALQAQAGRSVGQAGDCDAPGCQNRGIPCAGRDQPCRHRVCGSHWIAMQGHCPKCGATFQRPAESVAAFPAAPVAVVAGMTLLVGCWLVLVGRAHG